MNDTIQRLDQLEAVATKAVMDTYGKLNSLAAFWAQKGVEGMRLAVAMETDTGVFEDIGAERTRQDAKWGQQDHDDFKWLAIATEELGEVAREILTTEFGPQGGGHGDIRGELVQTAAVIAAWIEAIDRRQDA